MFAICFLANIFDPKTHKLKNDQTNTPSSLMIGSSIHRSVRACLASTPVWAPAVSDRHRIGTPRKARAGSRPPVPSTDAETFGLSL